MVFGEGSWSVPVGSTDPKFFVRPDYTDDSNVTSLEEAKAADFDLDELSNDDELTQTNTDPLNPDTDGDGMPDGWEVANNLDPNNGADATGDPDQDGLTNVEEYRNGNDPRDGDSDGDGLANSYETAHGTDPFDADTDHDGISDNEDTSPTTPDQAAIYSAQSVTVWSPRP